MFDSVRNKILTDTQLSDLRTRFADKKIVFCSGCYDILQSGHAVFFNQCRQFGDILVVGVGRDEVISRLKGPGRPVNPENNRLYLVAAMQDVDYAVFNDSKIINDKIDFAKVLSVLRPDVFVLNDDDSAINQKQKLCKENNVKIEFVSRIVPEELMPTSTTRIIDKINFAYRSPLRIDFSGGWTDIPYLMEGKKGYVSNVAINPLIELKTGKFNFSGYPRGSGLSTSTAAKLLEMISAKGYNADSKNLEAMAEDLFNLENKELNWAIGRQDQYSIVFGGFNCFEYGLNDAVSYGELIDKKTLELFREKLLLIHTGASRNAQSAVEQVYSNFKTPAGQDALDKLALFGKEFANLLRNKDFIGCASLMEANFMAQKQLAPATTNSYLDEMYDFARKTGVYGGKICGAGGGGAFIFYCDDPLKTRLALKKKFIDCFEIDFDFEYRNIKMLNGI